MAQKLFEPFKKLPQQFQNLNLIQKFHDLTSNRSSECFGVHPAYNGGCPKEPSAIAFEKNLGLLAIGTQDGIIKIYGAPGVVFSVQSSGVGINQLAFIPHEVRLLSASGNGQVTLFELDPSDGSWKKCCTVNLPLIENEVVTSMVLGRGVAYIGSSTGTLRQIAVKDGRLSLGDDVLTTYTRAMLAGSVPLDKREQLSVDAPIVSLELQPNGENLLIGYADGCVAIAVPQPIPEIQPLPQKTENQQASSDVPADVPCAPTAEAETTVTPVNGDEQAPAFPPKEGTQEQSATECAAPQAGETAQRQSLPSTPVKIHSEKRSTLKLRTLTRGWRTMTSEKACEVDSCPPLAVPPAPRISHLLLRDQAVQYATWRQLVTHAPVEEVAVAYGDGAFQVWPISSTTDTIDDRESLQEPIIVSQRDHPSMPYGPLPCGAITKLLISPSVTGGAFTAFSGGLPRPEFEERHAVTVLLDQEHHVCFQFGSCIKDFFFIPNVKETVAPDTPVEPIKPFDSEPAAALLVLTERELVAIDLTQPTWPTYFSPYLTCLDASPVTSLAHVGKVPASILADTKVQWPIWGGLSQQSEAAESSADTTGAIDSDLVLLGHADGSISLVSLRPGDCTYLVGRIHTCNLFQPVNEKAGGHEVESWPPFRRVGMCISPPGVASFGDPRLAITQLVAVVEQSPDTLSTTDAPAATLTIVAGGAGGQVTVWSTAGAQAPFEPDVRRIVVGLIDPDVHGGKYTWAGGLPLRPFEGIFTPAPSSSVPFALHLSPCALIQVEPATAVTALAWERSWHLAAVGTVFGFALVDLSARCPVYTDFLLARLSSVGTGTTTNLAVAAATKTANSVASMQSAIVQRGKQLTVNMRQSFRRLKHLRTSTDTPKKEKNNEENVCEDTAGATLEVDEPMTAEGEAGAKAVAPEPPSEEKTVASSVTTAEPVHVTGGDKPTETATATNNEASGEVQAGEEEKAQASPEPPVIVLTDSSAASDCQHAVGSLLFTDTFVVSPTTAAEAPQHSPSLWVGTSSGRVLAHTLDWAATSGPVTVRLAKELQLQHQAPVLGIAVVNASANRAPVGHGERTRHSHEPAAEVPAVKPELEISEAVASDNTDQATETAVTSEAEAAAVTQTPAAPESHQLLVCSAEQVKLFALPALRALHKHKVVSSAAEHLTNLLHSSLSSKHSTAAATVEPEKTLTTEGDDGTETEQPEAVSEHQSVGEVDPKCSTSPTASPSKSGGRQLHRKSLNSFALQQFTKACGAVEWAVVASRRDGKVIVLALPTLRRQYKAASPSFVGQQPSSVLACAADTRANTVFWWCTSAPLLVATELGNRPKLAPKAMTQPNAEVYLTVPEWSRPRKPSNASKSGATKQEEPTAASTASVANGQPGEECETPLNNKDQHADTSEATANSEAINDSQKTSGDLATTGGPSIMAVGDVTVDSIREYLNGDDQGQLTVKTVETSTEKHTLVEAGRVVTTLHETETVDGKLVKDDFVKISSDDPGADCVLQTATGSS